LIGVVIKFVTGICPEEKEMCESLQQCVDRRLFCLGLVKCDDATSILSRCCQYILASSID